MRNFATQNFARLYLLEILEISKILEISEILEISKIFPNRYKSVKEKEGVLVHDEENTKVKKEI